MTDILVKVTKTGKRNKPKGSPLPMGFPSQSLPMGVQQDLKYHVANESNCWPRYPPLSTPKAQCSGGPFRVARERREIEEQKEALQRQISLLDANLQRLLLEEEREKLCHERMAGQVKVRVRVKVRARGTVRDRDRVRVRVTVSQVRVRVRVGVRVCFRFRVGVRDGNGVSVRGQGQSQGQSQVRVKVRHSGSESGSDSESESQLQSGQVRARVRVRERVRVIVIVRVKVRVTVTVCRNVCKHS